MGRGRKPNSIQILDYNTVFYNSVGSYVQRINNHLARKIKPEPLSNHIRIVGGFAFKSTDYLNEGIPVIRISDFSDEKIDLKNVKFYKESESLKKYELKTGDIIIALTGGTIAKLGIVQDNLGKLYLNQRVGKFEVLNPAEFESEYVYWIARSVQAIIKELAWGAAIPNVSTKQIEKLKFPIPEKKVQRGIIMFLNDMRNNSIETEKRYFHKETEEKILFMHQRSLHSAGIVTELTHQQALLKKLRQQILQEAIEGRLTADWRAQNPDVEPASELLARIQAEKQQLIKDKKIKKQKALPSISEEEKPLELPEDWAWCRLGDLLNKFSTGPFGSMLHKSDYVPSGIPLVNPTNIVNGAIVPNGKMMIDQETKKRLSKYILKAGEFIIARRGDLSKCAVVGKREEGWLCGTGSFFIQPSKRISKEFFVKTYRSCFFQKQLADTSIGSTMANLNQKILNESLFPLPPLPEQKVIVTKVEKLLALCDQLQTQITENQTHAEQLMQAVLKEAFAHSNESSEKVLVNA